MATIGSRRLVGLGLALAVGALAACSGGGTAAPSTSGNASAGTTTSDITFWDPYPQREAGSDWDKLVKSCAPAGATITRTSAPQTDLFNQLTTAVHEGNAPDIVVLDNPMMPDAVSAGLLATASQAGIDVSGIDQNLIGPGVVDGQAYGIPLGSNALGLYYNKKILDAAGVDPASITDWASLNAAIGKVVTSGAKGITFSGIAGEEGVFQFEPWFWGAGADLSDLGSAPAIKAGQLLSDWIGKGWAPRSAVTDNQSASWDLFLTGEYGFAENGSWFASAAAATDGLHHRGDADPGEGRRTGSGPDRWRVRCRAGAGERRVGPLRQRLGSDHCLSNGDNAETTSETLGYLSASPDMRAKQVAQNPLWKPWAADRRGRPGPHDRARCRLRQRVREAVRRDAGRAQRRG